MKENMCGSVNTRCLQSIASKCSVYQTNFNFFDQTKIMSTSCSRHAQFLHDWILLSSSTQTGGGQIDLFVVYLSLGMSGI